MAGLAVFPDLAGNGGIRRSSAKTAAMAGLAVFPDLAGGLGRLAVDVGALAGSEGIRGRPDEQDLHLFLKRSPGMDGPGGNNDRLSGPAAMANAIDLDPHLAVLDQHDFLVLVPVPRNGDAGLDPVAQHADVRRSLLVARDPSAGHADAHLDFGQGTVVDQWHQRAA